MATLPLANKPGGTPPYLPFARFLESLDSIASCLPREINRTTWTSESPYIATVLASAYCFLGLAESDGTPTPLLHRLASERSSRTEILREMLRSAYGDILDPPQNGQSAQDLEVALATRYRLSGATHRKAVSFLVQACRFTGLAVPSSLGRRSRISHAKREPLGPGGNKEATSITVNLKSGGEITITGHFNPFTISPEDRKLIFKLVDQLSEYQTASNAPAEAAETQDDEVPF